MDKLKFIEQFGQDPEEMFGEDWEIELLGLMNDEPEEETKFEEYEEM